MTTHIEQIRQAHKDGMRALIHYEHKSGGIAKGLAVENPRCGVGEHGTWYVCVDSFVNRIDISQVIKVEAVPR